MKIITQKKLLYITLFSLLLLTACGSGAKDVPETPSPVKQTPLEIDYCNVDATNLCIEGFGTEGDENLLVLLKADSPDFKNIYIGVTKTKDEVYFSCANAEDFPENIYCNGEIFSNGENIQLKVYAKESNELIAEGEFKIQYGDIQTPGNIEFEKLDISSPPDYPNYPNSSYENPASTP